MTDFTRQGNNRNAFLQDTEEDEAAAEYVVSNRSEQQTCMAGRPTHDGAIPKAENLSTAMGAGVVLR